MKSRKKIRRVFQPFRYVECDEFAEYLHRMSLKGWHFKEWSAGLIFEKGEPVDITYDVEVFPKGTEMDTRPEDDAQEYAEYCQAAGWQFIDGQRKFCIFRKMEDDAPPIVTEEEKLKNIRKAEGRVLFSNVLFLVFFTALQYAQLFTQVERFFVNIWIFILAVVSLITVVRIAQLIYLNIWYVSMKRRIRQGRPIRFYGRKGRWLYGALTLLLFAGGVIFFGMEKNKMGIFIFIIGIAAVMLLYLGISVIRPSRGGNWGAQIAGSFAVVFVIIIAAFAWTFGTPEASPAEQTAVAEELPLRQTDYRKMDGEVSYAKYEYMESFLGNLTYAVLYYDVDDSGDGEWDRADRLNYQIYRSEFPQILEYVWRDETKAAENDEECAELWGAREAYMGRWHDEDTGTLLDTRSYRVRYDGAVLVIHVDEPLDEEQIGIVREKLGL